MRQRSSCALLATLTTLAVGCANAPPRVASVDVAALLAVQRAAVAGSGPVLYSAFEPGARAAARWQSINLVVARDGLVWAAPEIDLTPVVLRRTFAVARVGERVAFVDLQSVISQTIDGKREKAKLRDEFEHKQAELDGLQTALKQSVARGDSDSPRAIQDLRQRYQELQGELKRHEDEAVHALLAKLSSEVGELARAQHIDVVFDRNVKPDEVVVYRDGTAFPPNGPDLTADLIRLHDQRFP